MWAIAREKLATSIELRMNSLHDELHELEEKADKTTAGSPRQDDRGDA